MQLPAVGSIFRYAASGINGLKLSPGRILAPMPLTSSATKSLTENGLCKYLCLLYNNTSVYLVLFNAQHVLIFVMHSDFVRNKNNTRAWRLGFFKFPAVCKKCCKPFAHPVSFHVCI